MLSLREWSKLTSQCQSAIQWIPIPWWAQCTPSRVWKNTWRVSRRSSSRVARSSLAASKLLEMETMSSQPSSRLLTMQTSSSMRSSLQSSTSSNSATSRKWLVGTTRFHKVSHPLSSPRIFRTISSGLDHSEVTVDSSTATLAHLEPRLEVPLEERKRLEADVNQDQMPGNSTWEDPHALWTTQTSCHSPKVFNSNFEHNADWHTKKESTEYIEQEIKKVSW